ncbi:MAG: mechanosensitive ion channel family protein [Proteobacteria bacterium]|nr:mechanosensitive ion channel family protein [Pseudomonadota bacterium]MBU1611767.1 mechanosensitive ion channel family protein [Pseudomonadota bacterium]
MTMPESPLIRLTIAACLFLLAIGLVIMLRRRLTRSLPDGESDEHAKVIRASTSSAALFLILLAARLCLRLLPLDTDTAQLAWQVLLAALTLTGISLGFDLFRLALDRGLRRKGSSLNEHKGRVLLPVVQGLTWLVAVAFLLDNYGVKIGTILAGMGVAGIAIGFAAQAVLGDLFSYFAILFDHPFRIGDFITIGEVRGHIEHIGLKTSRIRSLDGEQIVMSNTDLTSSRVKNFRRMTRRRGLFSFGVLYSTPHAQLTAIPVWVKEIIDAIPLTTFDRAHFCSFGESSLDFEVVYFVESPEINDFKDSQQRINLALVARFEQEGVGFAFPTRTLHMHNEPKPETTRDV